MRKLVFGKRTLRSIATDTYGNDQIVFREYVQNSCDAIYDAIKAGILANGEDKVTIDIDKSARKITIEDNGNGVSVLDFESKILDIGNSDKKSGTHRGFFGQGRLCGLAYCNTLIFTSTRKGEPKLSKATFDAEKLNDMLNDDEKYTAEIVLNSVVKFDEIEDKDIVDEHFFRVELLNVTSEVLLDVHGIRDYLSFVAPVTYDSQFTFQTEIYKHATELNFKIT